MIKNWKKQFRSGMKFLYDINMIKQHKLYWSSMVPPDMKEEEKEKIGFLN